MTNKEIIAKLKQLDVALFRKEFKEELDNIKHKIEKAIGVNIK